MRNACPGVPRRARGLQASSLDPRLETCLLLRDHVTVLATSTVELRHLVLPMRWQHGKSSTLDWLHVFRRMLEDLLGALVRMVCMRAEASPKHIGARLILHTREEAREWLHFRSSPLTRRGL